MSRAYPDDWDARRRAVYERDNYRCQNCGALGGPRGEAVLHAHHVVPKSKGGTNQLRNLQTLCSQCHGAIHGIDFAPTANQTEESEQSRLVELIGGCPICDNDQTFAKNKNRLNCSNCNFEAEIDGTIKKKYRVIQGPDELKGNTFSSYGLHTINEKSDGDYDIEEIRDIAKEKKNSEIITSLILAGTIILMLITIASVGASFDSFILGIGGALFIGFVGLKIATRYQTNNPTINNNLVNSGINREG